MTSPGNLLKAWNLRPKKQLGQNFLSDPSTARMIVDRAGLGPGDVVLEIGPGLGALTIPLARAAERVHAVEKDRRMIELLRPRLIANDISNVRVMENDILKVDIPSLAEGSGRKLIVMGNLPYNISSQVLVQLIHCRDVVDRAVLMFQKELAERIMASPGCKAYGRLTVMLGYCAGVRKIADIAASQFYPRPKVDSEVLEIRFPDRIPHPADDGEMLFRTIKAAFSRRRKTLKNSLTGGPPLFEADMVRNALALAEIDPGRRAETLTIEEFVRLGNAMAGLTGREA